MIKFFPGIRVNTLFSLLFISLLMPLQTAQAANPFQSLGGGGGADDILDVDQAFMLNTRAENGKVIARWDIAEGHYLYRDKIQIIPEDSASVTSGQIQLDPGELKHDEYFGDIYVYHHQAKAMLPITEIKNGAESVSFKVKYQGCSEISGICYPPTTKTVSLKLSPISTAEAASTPPQTDFPMVSEQDQIAAALGSENIIITMLLFFGFGLLLAFTPCVFPMIPILSSIIIGQGKKISTHRAFILSLVYVLAMAATYTTVGVIAGLFGENLQAAFQNPWILSSFAAVFVALSFSMFGFYDLQMPGFIQGHLTHVSNKQQGGTLIGVAIMGFLSALIVGPCVAAPLAGALIYIGQTGNAVLGGAALFALSMGMGAPLIAIGTSAGKLLPKAGAWMDTIKAVFGVMLLAVAIWMLERIIPVSATLILWAMLFIVSSIYMGALESLKAGCSGWLKLWKGLGIILFIYGVMLLIGTAAGGKSMLQPLKGIAGSTSTMSQTAHLEFKTIKGMDGLNRALDEAKTQNKTVMLDFYADWCISCKEMENLTFTNPDVQAALKNSILLQADVTANDEQDKSLYKQFGIVGPPAIIFYDAQGNELRNFRVIGYMPATKFGAHVKRAFQLTSPK